MDKKDKIIVSVLMIGSWLALFYSTSLPFISLKDIDFSLDKITWILWNSILTSKCSLDNWLCTFLYSDYGNVNYPGWPSFNFFIIMILVIPFYDFLISLYKHKVFMHKNLISLRRSLIGSSIVILFFILPILKKFIGVETLRIGFYMIVLSVVCVCLVSYYGIRRSRFDRDSNYQR